MFTQRPPVATGENELIPFIPSSCSISDQRFSQYLAQHFVSDQAVDLSVTAKGFVVIAVTMI